MSTAVEEDMSTPTRASVLIANLSSVSKRIAAASNSRNNHHNETSTSSNPSPAAATSTSDSNSPAAPPVRLVAVSKLKPASDILALHSPPTSHLHFGENYMQELLEKSKALPPEIRWHFIGGLQSNKCVTLAREVRGLWAVESVDTEKKASLLDKGWGERAEFKQKESEAGEPLDRRLRVFVQVNTSGEENKSGIQPGEPTLELCRFIREKCPRLKLQGLMTIGAIARSKATTPENENEDFACLRDTRDMVVEKLSLKGEDTLELSMGMSNDFEGAIAMGSNQVRVGSTIFGARPPKGEAKS
ncbi:pyridoxal phosphate homeostasis protein [Trichophyton mentagrophytes]|uniref:Pyridoxal phosphate homeostasis protein n=2 Tax=Trichophyton interdigitale TaxID=101480 RepID=A0A9P4YMW5_9EURO|nr:YggS family pyridoxal phosphate enzyme [Trichophyton interdigitale H6]KAF3897461.1 Pyridoxal phosphate homeostasis protein [Trichophyton interdigitale]KDB25968.1 YggS family pyridoxal phosphate enzyme [Trichophyton interdigitale MR816]GBF67138.1 pyridoxal phosphate homeostasis protein [Trichophyton mentagrophytes]KAF3899207.1 Pyridoxal phosphate homeostasis protein [Trichophyton interdigitale]